MGLEKGKLYRLRFNSDKKIVGWDHWDIMDPLQVFMFLGWEITPFKQIRSLHPIEEGRTTNEWLFEIKLTFLVGDKIKTGTLKSKFPFPEYEQYIMPRETSEKWYVNPKIAQKIWNEFSEENFRLFEKLV